MVYTLLATGFEEIEALTVVDILRRAEIPVKMVSVTDDLKVTGAHGIEVVADCMLSGIEDGEL
ncbi:MAG: DJ-1/PfpI family protein, partial [Clostridia bacterium]|nr:DJ-1/PfpI family protein [Clostridia bacterium]